MTLETFLVAVLSPLVDGAVFPDVAPVDAPLPRLVYQQTGGSAVAYMGDELPDMENARMQVTAWAATRASAKTLIKAAEAALRQAAELQADPVGASVSTYEDGTRLYGSRQEFSIWADC
jgi:hypothetical protein